MTKLFEEGDIFTRQMVLKILGSNFILQDKKLKIQAKYAFVFFKDVQEQTYKENLWLEPRKIPQLRAEKDFVYPSVQLCAEERT